MHDILWNSRVLGAMQAHACLTDDELNVMKDWMLGKEPEETAFRLSMSTRTVERIRTTIRKKYDGIQGYTGLPPRVPLKRK